jgi:hypothetical protein
MTDDMQFWCWTEASPATFRCRERGHDVRESSPGGLTARNPGFAVTLTDAWVALKNENTELLAKLDRQRVNARLAEASEEKLRMQVTAVGLVLNRWQNSYEQADESASFAEFYSQVLAALNGGPA